MRSTYLFFIRYKVILYVKKAVEVNEKYMPTTKILVCSSDVGAGKLGASLGPDALRISAINHYYNLFERLPMEEIKIRRINSYSPGNKKARYIRQIYHTDRKIADKTCEMLKQGNTLLVLSGDHSNVVGFFSGFREAFPDKKLGLIWVDAHGDIHTPLTSPSGNMHGMPVAALLAFDNESNQKIELKQDVLKNWNRLKYLGKQKISPKLDPEDLVYIGIRDLEEEEWAAIERLDIKNYPSTLVHKLGIKKVANDVVKYFEKYDYVYISWDADSLDPTVSRGTGTPVPGGLSLDEAEILISALTKMPNFKVLEITEINPLLDIENSMADAVIKVLRNCLTGEHPVLRK
jgi:arginase